MTKSYSISGMQCEGCEQNVERLLSGVDGVVKVMPSCINGSVEIESSIEIPLSSFATALLNSSYRISQFSRNQSRSFWMDKSVWAKACINTLYCWIGCAIGDFGMIIYLQANRIAINMSSAMMLAVISGLLTSIMFEATILKIKEEFSWRDALKTALGMSFISMLAMELTENTVDFLLVGSTASIDQPYYWLSLGMSSVAGFTVPLPYNYFRLKKYRISCY